MAQPLTAIEQTRENLRTGGWEKLETSYKLPGPVFDRGEDEGKGYWPGDVKFKINERFDDKQVYIDSPLRWWGSYDEMRDFLHWLIKCLNELEVMNGKGADAQAVDGHNS